jgi:hypothetical protein
VAGFAWCVLITPFMSAVWAYSGGESWANAPLIERTFGPPLERSGWLEFGPNDLPYEVFGKGFFLVYWAMLPVVRLVRDRSAVASDHAVTRVFAKVLYQALWVALVADFVSYWGVSVPGSFGETLWGAGFMIEMLALVALMVSTAIYGVAAARAGYLAWPMGALMFGSVIAVAPSLLFITGYIPNGVVLPLSAAWAVLAVWMYVDADSTT